MWDHLAALDYECNFGVYRFCFETSTSNLLNTLSGLFWLIVFTFQKNLISVTYIRTKGKSNSFFHAWAVLSIYLIYQFDILRILGVYIYIYIYIRLYIYCTFRIFRIHTHSHFDQHCFINHIICVIHISYYTYDSSWFIKISHLTYVCIHCLISLRFEIST